MLGFLRRSVKQASKDTLGVLKMRPPAIEPTKPLYSFETPDDVDKKWLVGTDKDLGGFSTASLTFHTSSDPTAASDDSRPYATFEGSVSTRLPTHGNIAKSGYAAIKSRLLPATLFGSPCHDLTRFRMLGLRVRSWDEIARQYFVNVKATTYAEEDLYQYPMELSPEQYGKWQDVMIPFRSFVLTHRGFVLEVQRDMPRGNVESVGISIAHQDGPFKLDIKEIRGVNPEGESEGELERDLLWASHSPDQEKAEKLSQMLGKQGGEQN
ncbi:hypothetical protein RI367_005877 [Sorochytrium milnesiophthora]